MNCTNCGAQVPEGSAFCQSCGTATRDPTAATVALEAVPAPVEDPLLAQVRKELSADYEIEKELGRGGMAVVYRGVERQLQRQVAIKVVPPEMAVQGDSLERFKREARLAAQLDHQNIIPVYRVGQAGPLLYMAMKYVEGRGVDSIIESQGALPVPIALRILRAAASGLAFAHDRGIVHRDIKGANILIDKKDGRIMVSDFGIARAMEDTSLTKSGMVVGTPNYMSPEQCGGQKVGPQSDQYSLGILGFQMLTGQLPFEADSIMGVIQHHYMTPPPDIRQVREDVPDELLAVIYQSLAKKPEERFATTQAMADALEAVPESEEDKKSAAALIRQLSQGEAVAKVRTGTLPPLALTAAITGGRAATAAPTVKFTPRPKKKPRRWLVPTVVVTVLAVGGGAAGFILLGGRTAPPATAAVSTAMPAAQSAQAAPPPQSPPANEPTASETSKRPSSQDRPRQQPRQTTQQPAPEAAAPAPAAPAGVGSVLGSVQPADASITLNGVTRSGPRAFFSNVPAGTHTVTFSKPGCQTTSRSVTVSAGGQATARAELTCT
jgi:serine/threonine-protein kinase